MKISHCVSGIVLVETTTSITFYHFGGRKLKTRFTEVFSTITFLSKNYVQWSSFI